MTERNTWQKQVVLRSLMALANHPTAEMVYEHLRTDYPSISRATVYRLLNRFADSGQIQKVHVHSGADHFDHTLSPHYHVCCSACGRVSDVELPYISGLEQRVGECSGYHITGYSMQFDGLCPDCAQKEDPHG